MDLSQEYLKECFDYNPDTGELIWKVRPRRHFKTDAAFKSANARFAGRRAGTKANTSGRYFTLHVGINDKKYLNHRVIWAMIYGDVPQEIDHVNHDATDNRLCNLRLANPKINAKNKSMQKNSVSGHLGVNFYKRIKKWQAFIKINNTRVYLGSFAKKADAIAARKQAERDYGFHPNHGARR